MQIYNRLQDVLKSQNFKMKCVKFGACIEFESNKEENDQNFRIQSQNRH